MTNELQCRKTYLLRRMPYKVTDQPAHVHNLMRVFVVSLKELCIPGYPKCAQWRFWSACPNAQTGQNLHWAHRVCFMTLQLKCPCSLQELEQTITSLERETVFIVCFMIEIIFRLWWSFGMLCLFKLIDFWHDQIVSFSLIKYTLCLFDAGFFFGSF